ncbi:protein TIFY 10A-like [Nicotiana tabacum]|uniref:Protein TIFY n=2 Tax=Nicotiana TaxID=4085 RepID=T1WMB6_TOBAC|nr:protein TIFY 10A-like [Nicotiana tabacum]AGU37272.1 jasmonate ZIM-domain protein 3b [Nicotiana tabacum]
MVDSGRFAAAVGQKSHFSQTCNLLSQYLKEKKGSFGDLSLGIHRAGTTTMDLLPMIEKSGESNPQKSMYLFPQTEAKSEPEKAQMTIFYGGQVIVFNDFPADKAKEIMLMASCTKGNNNSTTQIQKTAESASDLVPQPIISGDLPIARRASLTRFLEKRKDRLTAKAPYQLSNPNKQVAVSENKAWLELGAQFPVKTEQF